MKAFHLPSILILAATPCCSFLPASNRRVGKSKEYGPTLMASKEAPEVYPLSQRKALLIKEAQRLDPALAKDGKGVLLVICIPSYFLRTYVFPLTRTPCSRILLTIRMEQPPRNGNNTRLNQHLHGRSTLLLE